MNAHDLGIAGLHANLEYWKNVALKYQKERDDALKEVRIVREELYRRTGRRMDGHDYLREIVRTRHSMTLGQWLKHLVRSVRNVKQV